MSGHTVFIVLVIFNSLSFIGYGTSCLVSSRMRAEFERYHIPNQRVMVGFLEIAGACGLILGLYFPALGIFAASGLSILMMLGFSVRLVIKDGFVKTLPAILYFILSLYLVYGYIQYGQAAGMAI